MGPMQARETEVVELLESVFWNDEDDKTRRRARKAVTSYVRAVHSCSITSLHNRTNGTSILVGSSELEIGTSCKSFSYLVSDMM
jgi:hypothetical protein